MQLHKFVSKMLVSIHLKRKNNNMYEGNRKFRLSEDKYNILLCSINILPTAGGSTNRCNIQYSNANLNFLGNLCPFRTENAPESIFLIKIKCSKTPKTTPNELWKSSGNDFWDPQKSQKYYHSIPPKRQICWSKNSNHDVIYKPQQVKLQRKLGIIRPKQRPNTSQTSK